MFVGSGRGATARKIVVCLSVVGNAGCSAGEPLERAGVTLKPPEGWQAVAAATWPVPGTPLAAWSGPGGSSLVAYRGLPVPEGRPESVALALVYRLENNPGLRVVARSTVKLGSLDAARVDVVAPGTGDALAPVGRGSPLAEGGKALRPTRCVVVTAVRPADTLTLVWHAPEADAAALESQVRATLGASKFDRGRLSTSSY